MDSKPNISVIIPMYNASKTIARCLRSVISGGIPLEIIVVDDCSRDDSYAVVQAMKGEIEAASCQLKLLSNEVNSGVASSRQRALSEAIGDYIYWVDADDYLDPLALSIMYREAVSEDYDVVGCDWWLSFEQNERKMTLPRVRSGHEALLQMAYGVMKWNLWLYLVKRELIEKHKIAFDDGMNMGEDMMFMGRVMLAALKVKIVEQPLYHYVRTREDALTQNYTDKFWLQVDHNLRRLSEFFPKDQYQELLHQYQLTLKLPLLITTEKKDYLLWREKYPEANRYIRRNPYLSVRTVALQWLAARGCWPMVYLYNVLVHKFVYGILYK